MAGAAAFMMAYLAGYEKLMTAGIGYDFQIYPSLPQDALDQAVDMIVTEKEVIMPFGY